MNEMQVMNVQGIECYEKDGVAYLKLEAVARGLGFTRVAESGNEVIRWERVNNYLKELNFMPTSGHDSFIPENIFYRLAMKAKNAVAEAFQAKVADEIIPSIRRTGGYIVNEDKLSDDELIAKALIMAQDKIKQREERIKALEAGNAQLTAKVEEDAPKVLFAQSVEASDTSILIGQLAKQLKQNGLDIGQKRLFERLRQEGFLCKAGGRQENLPTQRAMDMGLFEIKERAHTNPDGTVLITRTTLVSGKGQVFFTNRYLAEVAK